MGVPVRGTYQTSYYDKEGNEYRILVIEQLGNAVKPYLFKVKPIVKDEVVMSLTKEEQKELDQLLDYGWERDKKLFPKDKKHRYDRNKEYIVEDNWLKEV